jgi:hypothetical protein
VRPLYLGPSVVAIGHPYAIVVLGLEERFVLGTAVCGLLAVCDDGSARVSETASA